MSSFPKSESRRVAEVGAEAINPDFQFPVPEIETLYTLFFVTGS